MAPLRILIGAGSCSCVSPEADAVEPAFPCSGGLACSPLLHTGLARRGPRGPKGALSPVTAIAPPISALLKGGARAPPPSGNGEGAEEACYAATTSAGRGPSGRAGGWALFDVPHALTPNAGATAPSAGACVGPFPRWGELSPPPDLVCGSGGFGVGGGWRRKPSASPPLPFPPCLASSPPPPPAFMRPGSRSSK